MYQFYYCKKIGPLMIGLVNVLMLCALRYGVIFLRLLHCFYNRLHPKTKVVRGMIHQSHRVASQLHY